METNAYVVVGLFCWNMESTTIIFKTWYFMVILISFYDFVISIAQVLVIKLKRITFIILNQITIFYIEENTLHSISWNKPCYTLHKRLIYQLFFYHKTWLITYIKMNINNHYNAWLFNMIKHQVHCCDQRCI